MFERSDDESEGREERRCRGVRCSACAAADVGGEESGVRERGGDEESEGREELYTHTLSDNRGACYTHTFNDNIGAI